MSTPLEGEPSATAQATILLPPPEALAFARELAEALGEQEEKPIIQIARRRYAGTRQGQSPV